MDGNRLRGVLRAIDDGTPVEWTGLESTQSGDPLRNAGRDLKTLSVITACHRALQSSSLSPLESQEMGFEPPTPAAGEWGPLVLLERIGAGSFGEVYRAWERRLDREVALKLLRPTSAAGAAGGIVHEGRLLARVLTRTL